MNAFNTNTNTKNVSIALLTITAVVLGLLLAGIVRENQAYAASPAAGGRYIMITAQYSAYVDLLCVIEVLDQKINVYAYNQKTRGIDPVDQTDLRKAFRTVPQSKRKPRRGY